MVLLVGVEPGLKKRTLKGTKESGGVPPSEEQWNALCKFFAGTYVRVYLGAMHLQGHFLHSACSYFACCLVVWMVNIHVYVHPGCGLAKEMPASRWEDPSESRTTKP
jgi:hypothetical protein